MFYLALSSVSLSLQGLNGPTKCWLPSSGVPFILTMALVAASDFSNGQIRNPLIHSHLTLLYKKKYF